MCSRWYFMCNTKFKAYNSDTLKSLQYPCELGLETTTITDRPRELNNGEFHGLAWNNNSGTSSNISVAFVACMKLLVTCISQRFAARTLGAISGPSV